MKRFKRSPLYIAIGISFGLASTASVAAPGLVDVYQMAQMHDAKLAQAQASYQAEQEIMVQARALLLPEINATATAQNPDISDSDITQAIGIELNQALFNKQAFSRFEQAKSQLKVSELKYRLAEQDLIVRVSQAYFDVLLAEQELRLAKSKEEADKIQWEKAQASADVGLASRTDVLQARSSYDLSISNRISAENTLDKTYESLTKLTGKTVREVKQLMLSVELSPQTLDKTSLELKAEADNLAVRSAQHQSDVASEEVSAQKSGHWFTVGINARYSNNLSCPSGTGCFEGDNTSVTLQASIPLYKGGSTSSKITEARFNSQAANIAVRDAREQARLDARVQAQNIERSYALVAALREAVKSSEAFLEAAEEGYRVGLRNMIDVVTARANVFNAQSNLAAAIHGLLLTQLQLEGTLGDLSVDDLRDIDQLLTQPN